MCLSSTFTTQSAQRMKAIQLTKFDAAKDGYTVYLGNATWHKVPSKRAAKKFLAETNRFLTAQMVELNEIYMFAFTQYRLAYFIFRNEKNGHKTNYSHIERQVKYHLQTVEELFDRTFTVVGENKNAWSFINTFKICFALSEAIKALAEINRSRNNTVVYYMINNYLDRIRSLEEKAQAFSNGGKE